MSRECGIIKACNRDFAVKTRRGNVVKIVRERYLRKDIPCRFEGCSDCDNSTSIRLSASATHILFVNVDFLLSFLDLLEFSDWTDVVVLQTVFERFRKLASGNAFARLSALLRDPRRRVVMFDDFHSEFCFVTREAGVTLDQYVSKVLMKTAVYFANHTGVECVVIDDAECTSPPTFPLVLDYMRAYGRWSADTEQLYSNLLEARHKQAEAQESISALNQQIADLSLQEGEAYTAENTPDTLFDKHLDEELMRSGVKSGLFYRGHFRADKHNSQESGHVDCGGEGILVTRVSPSGPHRTENVLVTEVLVQGQRYRNRAIDGDEVVIQLLPESDWVAPSNSIITGEAKTSALSAGQTSGRRVPTARVVGIWQRNWRSYVATIQESDTKTSTNKQQVLCVPFDRSIPKIRIRTRQVAALAPCRILVNITDWPAHSRYPNGYYIRQMGRIGELQTEIDTILHEHAVLHAPLPDFSGILPVRRVPSDEEKRPFAVGYRADHEAKKPMNPYSWQVPSESARGRLDLRQSHAGCICSIDPPGCTDIDDALSVLPLDNGNVQIGVHIADVTHFVQHGNALDLEARSRSTTVYLVDRRLDMLPTVLSEDLCSLRGGTDRLAVSVLWEVNKQNKIVKTWFGRTIIHNSFAFSYKDAQTLIDHRGHVDERAVAQLSTCVARDMTTAAADAIKPKLQRLVSFADALKDGRVAAGAVELEELQVRFELDDGKNPVKVAEEEHLHVHSTVAELMIQANRSVAEYILQAFPTCALLRHHPEPKQHKFEALEELAASQGLSIDTSSNKALAASLNACAKSNHGHGAWLDRILRSMATKAMSEAHYVSTGSFDVADLYHYGLATPFYTHFTSPIRRYADVIVHRLLLEACETRGHGTLSRQIAPIGASARPSNAAAKNATRIFTSSELDLICDHLNHKNRSAKLAARESANIFLMIYLKAVGHPTGSSAAGAQRAEAIVFRLKDNGMLVIVPKYQIKGGVVLQDEDGRALLSPYEEAQFASTLSTISASLDEHNRVLRVRGSTPASTFDLRLFDRVVVDVLPQESRYRHMPPQLRLVWKHTLDLLSRSRSRAGRQHLTANAATKSRREMLSQLKQSQQKADSLAPRSRHRSTQEKSLYAVLQQHQPLRAYHHTELAGDAVTTSPQQSSSPSSGDNEPQKLTFKGKQRVVVASRLSFNPQRTK